MSDANLARVVQEGLPFGRFELAEVTFDLPNQLVRVPHGLQPQAPSEVFYKIKTIIVDAGHGGIDPGAERGSQTEAQLMLGFARE